MFSEYREVLENAEEMEQATIEAFDSKREENVIEIQTKMKEEALNISKNQHLKNYNPIEYYNSITTLKHQHDKLIQDEKEKLQKLREVTDLSLFEVMNINPPISEIYKVISCDISNANNYRYICRVWFTLVEIDEFKCKPGDPIRIEWIDTMHNNIDTNNGGINAVEKRTAPGLDGLKIPNFVNISQVNSRNQFYSVNNWGETSNQKKWWIEWVEANRPIPSEE